MALENKKIALYVTGGIAIYKVCDLVREFIKNGAEVKVAMTESACRFVSPLTFQILSKNKVYTDLFEEEDYTEVSHIHLADWADLTIVAPATANIIAKTVNGIADDFVSTSLLASSSPTVFVPAMNTNMWNNAATKRNIETLKSQGIHIVPPAKGFLAEGYEGEGRYPEKEVILKEITGFLNRETYDGVLKDKQILITAGGTKEPLDPVRFLTNKSSGKMGHALAEAAKNEGAKVILVTASELTPPAGINVIKVESADEMKEAVFAEFPQTDIVLMAAAVSDYKPIQAAANKIKKNDNVFSLELTKTTDILKELGKQKTTQYLLGFAAETTDIKNYAKKKISEKNLDAIVANDVSQPDSGFNVDVNEVTLFTKNGQEHHVPKADKRSVAKEIIHFVSFDLDEQ